MPDEQNEDVPDLTGATAYAVTGRASNGWRYVILADGETVRVRRPDGTWQPPRDPEKQKFPIITAATLRRGKETWEPIPLDQM
ncbi:hypothetical protein [Amycolatopsis sp. NPDC059021]|uniref:hypothetical protein n=1 Tax=Amycolatopsis sp. NPDC059021 TaxID=3346704 RepID=UPI00366BC379